jgi:hypothetical protein
MIRMRMRGVDKHFLAWLHYRAGHVTGVVGGSHWVVTIVTQGPPSEIRAWCPEHMEDSNAAVLG